MHFSSVGTAIAGNVFTSLLSFSSEKLFDTKYLFSIDPKYSYLTPLY
jgi:hypothetical protein